MSIRDWFLGWFEGDVPAAFVVRSSEAKRESVKPEDWEAYKEQRDAIIAHLKANR